MIALGSKKVYVNISGIRTLVIALGSGVFQEEIEALAYDQDSIYPFATYKSLMDSNYIHERICDGKQCVYMYFHLNFWTVVLIFQQCQHVCSQRRCEIETTLVNSI